MTGLDTAAIKVTLGGHINGVQSWSCNLWLKATIDPLTLDMAGVAGALGTAAQTWGGVLTDFWTTDTKLDSLTAYEYPVGTVHALHQGDDVGFTVQSGSHSTNRLPTFCALVNTLRTAKSGRSYRGRIYVPITSLLLGADGQADSITLSTIATATRDMLDAWNALNLSAVGVTAQACVVASFSKGTTTPITAVHLDSLMDVQHRREDKIGASANVTEFV